jgi:hypothetical protein
VGPKKGKKGKEKGIGDRGARCAEYPARSNERKGKRGITLGRRAKVDHFSGEARARPKMASAPLLSRFPEVVDRAGVATENKNRWIEK